MCVDSPECKVKDFIGYSGTGQAFPCNLFSSQDVRYRRFVMSPFILSRHTRYHLALLAGALSCPCHTTDLLASMANVLSLLFVLISFLLLFLFAHINTKHRSKYIQKQIRREQATKSCRKTI